MNTIVKKKALCKHFLMIFPLQDNDLADFYAKQNILNNYIDRKLSESDLSGQSRKPHKNKYSMLAKQIDNKDEISTLHIKKIINQTSIKFLSY